jgi:UDP-N-acetylmuramyl pentapeptide phosphotransferase/UDP-N-acetylglucosamine-1-phosphate transferase
MTVVILAMVIPNVLRVPSPLRVKAMVGLLGPAIIVFLLGLFDDVHSVGPYWKFAAQAAAAVWLYAEGYGIHNLGLIHGGQALAWVYCLPLTILWVLLITNAFNLIDGLDGLAAGSALFSTAVVFVVSLIVPNQFVAFLAIALAGATLGFLRFNFHPASIFLGDSGSLFLGFMLSALALAGSQKATTIVAVAIPVVAFGLPILDVVLAVARRLIGAKPLFDGDHDHIHHKLLKRGLSHRAAVLVLYGATAGFGLLSVVLLRGEKMLAFVLVAIAAGVIFGVQQLRYVELSELSALFGAVFKKRIVANNVSIRRAAELLDTCGDREAFCRILQDTLQPLGFSGFRLENFDDRRLPESSIHPLGYDSKGRIQFCWVSQSAADPDWELRLQLTTRLGEQLGYLCLFQVHENRRQSFDLSVMTDGVRTSISDALQRTLPHDLAARQASISGAAASGQEKERPEKPALRRAAHSE